MSDVLATGRGVLTPCEPFTVGTADQETIGEHSVARRGGGEQSTKFTRCVTGPRSAPFLQLYHPYSVVRTGTFVPAARNSPGFGKRNDDDGN